MNLKAVLEGILFVVGDEGIDIETICNTLNVKEKKAKELLNELKKDYESESRGIRISFLGNKFKLTTKKEHKGFYEELFVTRNDKLLSNAALETLAIVAYNEPVTRSEIEEIRGINSDNNVRKLLSKGFIKEVGKKDTIGHPTTFGITNLFLDYFGLATKEDLPKISFEEDEDKDLDLYESRYKEN